MGNRWLDVTDIPAEGREFTFDDQTLLTEGLAEFGMDFVPDQPFSAGFTVIPVAKGLVVRGSLHASLLAPCDRCAGQAAVLVEQSFDLFEEEAPADPESLDPSVIRRKGTTLELDVGSLLWEEFLLGLPVKPLCREDCKGLCPVCGTDKNVEACDCGQDRGDPRLAALRGLKIDK